jgi:hypothetical protein
MLASCAASFVEPAHAQPLAPRNFSATAHGIAVSLSWDAPSDFRTRYRVEAGSAPGLTDIASFDLPPLARTLYTAFKRPERDV